MGTKAFVWGYPVKSNGLQQSESADDAVRALPMRPAVENAQIQHVAEPAHPRRLQVAAAC